MKETVSIVVCTYNGGKYLRQQLDSILAQTRPADEIIIQDDGSTDSTLEILQEYSLRHPEIRVYRNEGPHGVNGNFLTAIARATGDFIAISDQDDIWEADKTRLQLEAIGDNLLCSGFSIPFSSDGASVAADPRLPNYSLLRTLYVGTLAGHTMMLSRRLLTLLPDLRDFSSCRMYDAIFTIVAAAYDGITFIPETLVHQRRHTEAATFTAPTDNRITPGNILRTAASSVRLARELYPLIRERMRMTLEFLKKIDSESPTLKDAVRMLQLQTSRRAIDFLRLQVFCAGHCEKLFHAQEKKSLTLAARGAFFPISCSIYFRQYSKSNLR